MEEDHLWRCIIFSGKYPPRAKRSIKRTFGKFGIIESTPRFQLTLKPHLHALKKSARHSQFSTCKRIGPKCNVAPVLKILGVPRLPPGGSLGTGKRGTVPKIWRAVCKWGLSLIPISTKHLTGCRDVGLPTRT